MNIFLSILIDKCEEVASVALTVSHCIQGSKIKIFSRDPDCVFKATQVLCIETSTFLGTLQKSEGAAGEFKRALGSRLPLYFRALISLQNMSLTAICSDFKHL